MASTAQDRLNVVYQSFSSAFRRRSADLRAATTEEQADAILDNVAALEVAYLTAARQALENNGPQVEIAYQAAVAAKKQVDDAYAQAKSLAARIGLVGDLVGKVGTLVATASGSEAEAA
jgi:epoxyqueuosine reductase QueG